MRNVVLFGGLVSALLAVAPASASVIDFNDLGSETGDVTYGSVTTGGFSFTNSLPLSSAFLVWQNSSANDGDGPGYALNASYPNTVTTVAKTDGSLFDFLSIDLNDFRNGQMGGSPFDVTFTFTGDLGSSTSTVAVDALSGFQNFTFAKTGLRSLQFTSVTNSVQFDNANFSAEPTSPAAVPEPASWAMIVLGFGLTGGMVRGRGKAARRTALAA